MKKFKIKKGDRVVVVTGASQGQKGNILKIDRDNDRVLIEGVNLIKKHIKPSAENPQGGIKEKEAYIHISNVAFLDQKTGEATRLGYKINDEGKKVRISKKSQQEV